jgi:hypothetical protein
VIFSVEIIVYKITFYYFTFGHNKGKTHGGETSERSKILLCFGLCFFTVTKNLGSRGQKSGVWIFYCKITESLRRSPLQRNNLAMNSKIWSKEQKACLLDLKKDIAKLYSVGLIDARSYSFIMLLFVCAARISFGIKSFPGLPSLTRTRHHVLQ